MSDRAASLAYCIPQSVLPGEVVSLHISAADSHVDIEVVRDGANPQVVWRATSVATAPQMIPEAGFERGFDWPATLRVPIASDWPSGLYLVRLTGAGATRADACTAYFVVRTKPERTGKILWVLSTTTWNAYNDMGGLNYYTGATATSVERPLARGFLDKPDEAGHRLASVRPGTGAEDYVMFTSRHDLSPWNGMAGWANWERRFAIWAERNGYELDYACGADLHHGRQRLDGYALYLSVGHDEYWSWEMRDAVESFVAGGGNAAFFSGNVSYWQIRFEDARQVCFKHRFREDPLYASRPQRVTTLWSDPLVGRPETRLTGSSFTRGGYSRITSSVPLGSGGYLVHRPEHWMFENTRLAFGDVLGAAPLVAGYECDGCEVTMLDGRPVATGRDGTPASFEIVASAPAMPFDKHSTELPLAPGGEYELEFHAQRLLGDDSAASCERLRYGHAILGSFQNGGTTVSSGCTDWSYGLDDRHVDAVTRNILDRLSRC